MFNTVSAASRVLLLALLVGLVLPASAREQWCGIYAPKKDHPLAWSNLAPAVEDRLDAGEYEAAYRFIVDVYDAHYGAQDEALLRALRQKMARYLERRKAEGERPSDWLGFGINNRNTYNLTMEGASGAADTLHSVSCSSDVWTGTESPEVAVFYVAAVMNQAAEEGIETLRVLAANQADAARRSYDDWLFNGLAMWPWELKANEFRIEKDFASPAPEWQLTLLRPSPALAIRAPNVENAELNYALMLEPFGYVRYLEGSRHREWWGVSPVVTVTDDNGTGYGLLARYNEFTLSAAHHESVDEVLVYFSIDLYQYLLSQEDRIRSARSFFSSD
jgi:hypothetical protein